MNTSLKHLEVISKILFICCSLLAGVWGIAQFLDKKHDMRVNESLVYVRRFSTDSLLVGAQMRVEKAWYPNSNAYQKLTRAHEPDKDLIVDHTQLLDTVFSGQEAQAFGAIPRHSLFQDLDILVNFFTELQICVRMNLCDRDVARSYFKTYARNLYCLHEPFINKKEENGYKDYGKEIREFARLTKSAKGSSACRK